MEESPVELFDYLRVIWKRKILIMVVSLVGIGVGVAVMQSRSKSPPVTSYRADVVIKIGQKLILTQRSGVSSQVEFIEDPADLERIIPRKYGFKANNPLGYHLEVKKIGNLSMLDLTMKGPDRGVEGVLKEIIDLLILPFLTSHSCKGVAGIHGDLPIAAAISDAIP